MSEQITSPLVNGLIEHNRIGDLVRERDALIDSGNFKGYLDFLAKTPTEDFLAIQKIVWARDSK